MVCIHTKTNILIPLKDYQNIKSIVPRCNNFTGMGQGERKWKEMLALFFCSE